GDRTLWLDHGKVRAIGDSGKVVARYVEWMEEAAAIATTREVERDDLPNVDHRSGDGRARISGIRVVDDAGRSVPMLIPGRRVTLRITAVARERVERPVVGFIVRN